MQFFNKLEKLDESFCWIAVLIGVMASVFFLLNGIKKPNEVQAAVNSEGERTIVKNPLRGDLPVVFVIETHGVKVYRFYDSELNSFGYFSIDITNMH